MYMFCRGQRLLCLHKCSMLFSETWNKGVKFSHNVEEGSKMAIHLFSLYKDQVQAMCMTVHIESLFIQLQYSRLQSFVWFTHVSCPIITLTSDILYFQDIFSKRHPDICQFFSCSWMHIRSEWNKWSCWLYDWLYHELHLSQWFYHSWHQQEYSTQTTWVLHQKSPFHLPSRKQVLPDECTGPKVAIYFLSQMMQHCHMNELDPNLSSRLSTPILYHPCYNCWYPSAFQVHENIRLEIFVAVMYDCRLSWFMQCYCKLTFCYRQSHIFCNERSSHSESNFQ